MSFIFRSFSRPSFIFFSLFFFLRVVRSRHYAAPLAKTEISRRSRRFPNSDEREKGLFVCVFLNKRIISKTNFIFFFLLGVSRVPRYPTRRAMATRCGLCDSRGGRATCANPNIACTLQKKKNLDFLFQNRGNKKKSKKKNGPVSCAVSGVRPRRSTNQRSA